MIKKAFSCTEVATREGSYTLCSEYKNHREWRRKPFVHSFLHSQFLWFLIGILTNEKPIYRLILYLLGQDEHLGKVLEGSLIDILQCTK